jgi:putative acetyltransferase
MMIRPALPSDQQAIGRIIRSAFAASEFGHNGEADLVRRLGEDGDIALSLVAEQDGQLVGHVLFSPMAVEADGHMLKAAALAPVSVIPQAQGKGVGSALIRAGLDQLSASGFQASFVLGHVDYYPRFGYDAALAAPYVSPHAGAHFMAVHLDSALALPQRGRADYAPAFARMDQE